MKRIAETKSRSIFRVLLVPLLAVIAAQILLMTGILLFGGVFDRLSRNMEEILGEQVGNRGYYLLNEMIGSWSDLGTLAEEVNACVQARLEEDGLSADELCADSEAYTAVLNELAQPLIETMYAKQVSGAFLILAGEGAPQGTELSLPGLYFRDRDPQAMPSQRLEDILAQRAPRGVVQAGHLTTDTGWKPLISAEDSTAQDYFLPYYTALSDAAGARTDALDYGYWTCVPYTLSGNSKTAISYSIPLLLEDGTVYGVLGVELLTEYIQSLLPAGELHAGENGAYLLAVAKGDSSALEPVVLSGSTLQMDAVTRAPFVLDGEDTASEESGAHYAAVFSLPIYSRNAPFEDDHWYLVGSVPRASLYDFVNQLFQLCLVAAAATLVVGCLGILLVSYRISRPVQRLSAELEQAQRANQIPTPSSIHILEIDQLVGTVTRLGREVLESSTRFLNIMDMASVDLAGFEIRDDSDAVFVTANYFPLLGLEGVDIGNLNSDRFVQLREGLKNTLEHTAAEDGSILYTVPLAGGGVRYVRAEQKRVNSSYIGLIEDVTSSVLEKKKVETERDHDVLTGLLSRQGFLREASRLFAEPERLKTAALLMLDLDKLKVINDKFGHVVGDRYIQKAGACFREHTPERTLCARISGDEFLVLYYGYDDNLTIWTYVRQLFQQTRQIDFVLPDGVNQGVSASGGLAWYPRDSGNLSELMKFSDFAMYCTKKQERGWVGEFDAAAYQDMLLRNQCRQEFYQVLEQGRLTYHFQPIFDARTGEPFAYEALMRVDMPNLRSPLAVLQIAKETDRMQAVETLTFFSATETYETLLAQRLVSPDAFLFINSIADAGMTDEDDRRYHERFQHLQKHIVVEITESANLDMNLLEKKKNVEGFSGLLALDDYGSGYNTELNLLELNPAFIKIDIAIVRNIHQDENKQQLVKNIVAYAHPRGMKIIAEGLEYPEEVTKLLELEVDLLQGYFLARPGAVPPPISEEARALLESFHRSGALPS